MYMWHGFLYPVIAEHVDSGNVDVDGKIHVAVYVVHLHM